MVSGSATDVCLIAQMQVSKFFHAPAEKIISIVSGRERASSSSVRQCQVFRAEARDAFSIVVAVIARFVPAKKSKHIAQRPPSRSKVEAAATRSGKRLSSSVMYCTVRE